MAAYNLTESGTFARSPSSSSARLFDAGSTLPTSEPALPRPGDYRPIGGVAPGLQTETDGSRQRSVSMQDAVLAVPSTPAAPEHSVKGVVDDIEGDHARATLSYGGRENRFLLNIDDLKVAGAAYPGALFEIIISGDFSYKIVHSVEEEEAARREAPLPDLSFLDE